MSLKIQPSVCSCATSSCLARPSYLQKIREMIPSPGSYFILLNVSVELLPVWVSLDMLPSSPLPLPQQCWLVQGDLSWGHSQAHSPATFFQA